jgi:hypothetical protein
LVILQGFAAMAQLGCIRFLVILPSHLWASYTFDVGMGALALGKPMKFSF